MAETKHTAPVRKTEVIAVAVNYVIEYESDNKEAKKYALDCLRKVPLESLTFGKDIGPVNIKRLPGGTVIDPHVADAVHILRNALLKIAEADPEENRRTADRIAIVALNNAELL